jgi:cysteate synthase
MERSRAMLPLDDDLARNQVEEIMAKVLSNRKPPYSIAGGLFDALSDTHGEVLIASNEEAIAAGKLFEEYEGIDLHPAAKVAAATLMTAVSDGIVDKNSIIMFNAAGGGEKKFKQDKELFYLEPSLVFGIDPDPNEVKSKIRELYS